jgi:hypothetical protein
MGGKVLPADKKGCATFWVFYRSNDKAKELKPVPPFIIKCRLDFITECYWSCGLLDVSKFEL